MACGAREACTAEGCAPAPSRLLVSVIDGGALLDDGGVRCDVAVFGVRDVGDSRFQLRSGLAALQLFGFDPPTPLVFPPGFEPLSNVWFVVDTDGDAVTAVERVGREGWACELHDCLTLATPHPRRAGGGLTWLRQNSPGEARLGRMTPRFEASGDYTVHVFTFYEGARPAWSLGALLDELPSGCDANVDTVRTFWNAEAQRWTEGAVQLRLDFVDRGMMPLPSDEVLARLGQPTVPVDPFRNEPGLLALGAFQRSGPRDLVLLALVTDGIAGGRAQPADGVTLVAVPRARFGFAPSVVLHELGHLFGAPDLYGAGPTGCAFEESDEFQRSDLFCAGGSLSRLTARELGWVLPDGGAAPQVTHVRQSPTSLFPVDPD